MRFLTLAVLFLFNSCQIEDPEMQQQLADLQAELATVKTELATAQTDPTGFIHAVYFWYSDGTTEARKQEFEQSLDRLAKVESIESVYYGHAPESKREVVDGTFDVAWVCMFKDSLAQEAYQIDPIHLKFVEENDGLWKKVQVYDSFASIDK